METMESLNISTNANQTDSKNSGEELIKRTIIENSPFTLIEEKEKGFYIVMGNHRITEPTETAEEQEELTKGINWNFLTTVIGTIISIVEDIKITQTIK